MEEKTNWEQTKTDIYYEPEGMQDNQHNNYFKMLKLQTLTKLHAYRKDVDSGFHSVESDWSFNSPWTGW